MTGPKDTGAGRGGALTRRGSRSALPGIPRHNARATRSAGQKMRSRLLDAAATLFKANGLNGTSVSAIAGAADAFPSQVTYYFRTKEALFVEAACRDMLHVASEAETVAARARTPKAYVSALVEEPACHVMILHVVELLPVVQEPMVASPFDIEPHRQDIEAAAHRLMHRSVPENLKTSSEVEQIVAEGKPYVAILDTAAERKADLIVIGAHGPGTLNLVRYGSTTSHVVRRASCPVLTVRQPIEDRTPARERVLAS